MGPPVRAELNEVDRISLHGERVVVAEQGTAPIGTDVPLAGERQIEGYRIGGRREYRPS